MPRTEQGTHWIHCRYVPEDAQLGRRRRRHMAALDEDTLELAPDGTQMVGCRPYRPRRLIGKRRLRDRRHRSSCSWLAPVEDEEVGRHHVAEHGVGALGEPWNWATSIGEAKVA